MSDEARGRPVDIEWDPLESLPLAFVNQMASWPGLGAGDSEVPDSINLVFGYAERPFVVGTPEAVAKRLAEVTSVSVTPRARLVMSRERADELMQVLATTIAQYDAIMEARRDTRA